MEMAKAIERLMEADFVHFSQQEVQHRLALLRASPLEGCSKMPQHTTMERSDTEVGGVTCVCVYTYAMNLLFCALCCVAKSI